MEESKTLYRKKGEEVTSEQVLQALVGSYESVEFVECVITAEFNIANANIERDANGNIPIRAQAGFSGTTFQESVRFDRATFHAGLRFYGTTFQGPATFFNVTFNEWARFDDATFQQPVGFDGATFRGWARFYATTFQGWAQFARTEFHELADFTSATFQQRANFKDVDYASNSIWRRVNDALHVRKRRLATPFYLDSEDVDGVSNPAFKRYVADQQFIRALAKQHPWFARLWYLSSDYGRSLSLWFLWSMVIAVGVGVVFATYGPLADSLLADLLGPLRPTFREDFGTGFTPFYFSIVTFTTLGFGDVLPSNLAGEIWVLIEVLLSYIMLGGLISIISNKLARRS